MDIHNCGVLSLCFVLLCCSCIFSRWFIIIVLCHLLHYSDIIMDEIASQTISLSIVYSTFCSALDQRKYQSPASLVFVWGIHRWPVNSPHKGPVTRKRFPFDDVIMYFHCMAIHRWSYNRRSLLGFRVPLGRASCIRWRWNGTRNRKIKRLRAHPGAESWNFFWLVSAWQWDWETYGDFPTSVTRTAEVSMETF